MNYDHILTFACEHPWAITRVTLRTIATILGQRVAGHHATAEQIEAAMAAKRDYLPQPTSGGGVGVLPVYGVIAPRMNMMTEMSGGTSLDQLTGQLRALVADQHVKTILLDVNSPGGNVAGVTEFTHEVLKAREVKPVIACANYTMASAAYWIASAATEIVATRSAIVGSVGVLASHDDLSKAMEQEGITREFISAGKHKADGHAVGPLSEDARAHLQASVDEAYTQFVTDIAKGRGVSVATVRAGYGEGRVLSATEALHEGMIDRIATFDEVLTKLVGRSPRRAMSAGAEAPELSAAAKDDADPLVPVADAPEADVAEVEAVPTAVADEAPAAVAPAGRNDREFRRRRARAEELA